MPVNEATAQHIAVHQQEPYQLPCNIPQLAEGKWGIHWGTNNKGSPIAWKKSIFPLHTTVFDTMQYDENKDVETSRIKNLSVILYLKRN